VQGCLRNQPIAATIRTRCARTGLELTLFVSAEGDVDVREKGASPLLFEPEIDWERFEKPHILDDF
jgi:hypothetical protein